MAERLKRMREAAGLSQAGLARRAGVPLRTYQEWEYARRTPLLSAAVKLAAALGVSVDELAGVVEWPPARRKGGKGGK
jgi:transcriptional regulator with XRE-family HTH domain